MNDLMDSMMDDLIKKLRRNDLGNLGPQAAAAIEELQKTAAAWQRQYHGTQAVLKHMDREVQSLRESLRMAEENLRDAEAQIAILEADIEWGRR